MTGQTCPLCGYEGTPPHHCYGKSTARGAMSDQIESALEFIGPVERHMVVLNGRCVPFLSATPLPGGRVLIVADDRLSVEMSLQDAEMFVPFLAQCIALGLGYASFPDSPDLEPIRRPDMPLMRRLEVPDA